MNDRKAGMCIRVLVIVTLGLAALFYRDVAAHGAGDYPSRPVNVVVPMPAGGVTDLCMRALAEELEKHFGKPFVIVNKPGGATTVGGYAVASAKPDGYYLGALIVSSAQPELFTYFTSAPYSSEALRPICGVYGPVLTLTVRSDSPWNSVQDVVEHARKTPGLKVATHGKGTLSHLILRTIAKKENIVLNDVPEAGGAPMIPAVLGGHVPVVTPAMTDMSSLLQAKQLKVLAVLTDRRAPFAPEIPSIAELGYKPAGVSYVGLFGPKGLPDEVVEKLNEAVQKIASDPAFQKKIYALYTIISYEKPRDFQGSMDRYAEGLRAFFREEGLVK
jgi:tripartite-type tricarboxylate transporter receptor subunit TctC